jgi:two-component system response regulator BaeR
VEDEVELAELMRDYLIASHYEVTCIHDGHEALEWLNKNQVDFIILDLMLPGIDGTEICKEVRKTSDTPIMMATARVDQIDRILGLEIGADDYVCKPYDPQEIIARIKAILRRVNGQTSQTESQFQLNENTLSISHNQLEVQLTLVEFRLLQLLYSEPGRIFSRQYIMDSIYSDYRVVSDRTIDSHIKKLRKKIQDIFPTSQVVHSIYGAGYKFELQEL